MPLLILFFVLMFITVAAVLWSGMELFREQEDPLGDRLVELQAHAMVSASQAPRRRGGGLLNTILYIVSLVPGGENWLLGTGEELPQARIPKRQTLATYALGDIPLLFALGGAA